MSDIDTDDEFFDKDDGRSKKRPRAEPDVPNKVIIVQAPVEAKVAPTTDFYLKTLNVQSLVNSINGFCAGTSTSVVITISEDGFQLRSQRNGSQYIVAFFGKVMFSEFTVKKRVEYTFGVARLNELQKAIKQAQYIVITPSEDVDMPGIAVDTPMNYDTGSVGQFTFNLQAEVNQDDSVFNNRFTYVNHVTIPSKEFKCSLDGISKTAKYLAINVDRKTLVFKGIDESGITTEQAKRTVAADMGMSIEALFSMSNMKPVVKACNLNEVLTISFPSSSMDINGFCPTLFSYVIDQTAPQSHFSMYVTNVVAGSS